jgi:hypothetical protein
MVPLTSEGILERFIGRACAKSKGDEFIAEVEAAGGINAYLALEPYKYLSDRHKRDAVACYYDDEVREELKHPRQVAERNKLITLSEAEPWRDEPVSEPS